jgi:hypothetical protein
VPDLPVVLGVDCSSKRSSTFDGSSFRDPTPAQLHNHLLKLEPGTLICWDAPLTGPSRVGRIEDDQPADEQKLAWDEYEYSSRLIERFFNRRGGASELRRDRLRPPDGVNTRHYSGMSHWAVTRALTGHPKIGPYDASARFPLAGDDGRWDPEAGTQLAEVHPAVALWLWLEPSGQVEHLTYKASTADSKDRVEHLARTLLAKLGETEQAWPAIERKLGGRDHIVSSMKRRHDRLDSFIAWALGTLWINGGRVIQLGDHRTGSFLVPKHDVVERAWDRTVDAAPPDLRGAS